MINKDMKNINKLTLESLQQTILFGAAASVTNANDLDRVANDLGTPINVVGIGVAISCSDQSLVLGQRGFIMTAIGTQNGYNSNTNMYTWITKMEKDVAVNDAAGETINQFIGNMKDVLFTIPTFSAEVSGGNSSKGQIFLNVRSESVGVISAVNYKAIITLYIR